MSTMKEIKQPISLNQIFNDALTDEVTSSEDPSRFVVRARRRLRTRLKRRSATRRTEDSSSSTSITNNESWPPEELDEEESIHIEMDDDGKELLLKDGSAAKEKKQSRISRILAVLANIPWFGNSSTVRKEITCHKVPFATCYSVLFLNQLSLG